MITVYDCTGAVLAQHEDWKRDAVRIDVENWNQEHPGDPRGITELEITECVFEDGIYRAMTNAERVTAGLMSKAEKYKVDYAAAIAARRAAYASESDPLKIEAEYDALIAGTEPDYTAWRGKVEEIKARIALPIAE